MTFKKLGRRPLYSPRVPSSLTMVERVSIMPGGIGLSPATGRAASALKGFAEVKIKKIKLKERARMEKISR